MRMASSAGYSGAFSISLGPERRCVIANSGFWSATRLSLMASSTLRRACCLMSIACTSSLSTLSLCHERCGACRTRSQALLRSSIRFRSSGRRLGWASLWDSCQSDFVRGLPFAEWRGRIECPQQQDRLYLRETTVPQPARFGWLGWATLRLRQGRQGRRRRLMRSIYRGSDDRDRENDRRSGREQS